MNMAHDKRITGMAAARDNPQQPKRELPDMIQVEQALFGAVFINNDALDRAGALASYHFQEPLHGRIFDEMLKLREAGKRITPVSIGSTINDVPKVGELSFGQYLARLAVEAVSVIHAGDYAEAIIKASARREMIYCGSVLSDVAYQSEIDIPKQIDDLTSRLAEVKAELQFNDDREPVGDAYLRIFQGSIAKDGVAGVPICLPEIAKVLSEPVFEAGNLYGFLSSSGEGKTSLTMQIIYHAIYSGHPVMFLSYDQSAGQCVRQMIAQVLGIEVRRQRDPQKFLKREEQDKCLDFAMWVNKQPLEIIRCQREGVSQLVAYGRRFVKRYGNGKTPLIVIDHIGKVKPRDPKLSADRISGDVTVELKSFADETSSAVLILNQRNSEGTKRDNPRPIARDLYGGEGAKADYDAILWLYRPEKYREERVAVAASDQDWKKINKVFGAEEQWKDIAEVGVVKSRFGDPSLREELKFQAAYTRYVSMRRQEPELFS
jgi:replicative DNA helicase